MRTTPLNSILVIAVVILAAASMALGGTAHAAQVAPGDTAHAVSWQHVDGGIKAGLSQYDQGYGVLVLQADLYQVGQNPGPVDGLFGAQTAQALQSFQSSHGLPASGSLDAATFTALMQAGGWTASGSSSTTGSQANAVTSNASSQQAAGPVLTMVASAYGPNYVDNYPYGPVDYYGQPLVWGDIAVDPSVIPLGSHVWISGYNSPFLPAGGFEAVAVDTGGAIQGNRVDIFINAPRSQVSKFGLQHVKVRMLSRGH